MRDTVLAELKKTFNPEFLNRVDETVVFHALGRPEMEQIVEILAGQLALRLGEKEIKLKLTAGAKELLIRDGFDPAYGARPLKRTIQRMLEDPLSDEILKGNVKPGESIEIDAGGKELVFRPARAKAVAGRKKSG
jgi:ATP-dependent Clp protease ATP-binding subunit ClpC